MTKSSNRQIFLALDIGNSNCKGGFFLGDELLETFSMEADPDASVAAYRHSLRKQTESFAPARCGLASVVPELSRKLGAAVQQELMVLPEFVRPELSLPITLSYRTPETLGADRIAAAAAGYKLYSESNDGQRSAVIVVDAGTAINYELITSAGEYIGGAIAAGPKLLLQALSTTTAQLPEIALRSVTEFPGSSTEACLRAGAVYGLTDGIAAMVDRLKESAAEPCTVVATGGLALQVSEKIDVVDVVEPHLVLYGIRWIFN